MNNNTQIDLLSSNELSKSNILTLADKLIEPLENGEKTALELDMQLKFIEETINEARKKINKQVLQFNIEKDLVINGCEISRREGYVQLNFNEDSECAELELKLKERKELLKKAHKCSYDLIDESTGEVIPKVSVKSYTKDSVSYTFKK